MKAWMKLAGQCVGIVVLGYTAGVLLVWGFTWLVWLVERTLDALPWPG